MPRPSQQRITGADVPAPQSRPVGLDVVASPTNTMVNPGDNEFMQLADALGKVHAPLARMQERKDHQAQKDAIVEARAQAARQEDPRYAADADTVLGTIPPALRHDAAAAYNEGIGERLGIDAKNDFLSGYAQESRKPGFNFDAYASEYRQKNLSGLGNPHLAIGAAKHIDHAIDMARGDFKSLQMKRLSEENTSLFATEVSEINPASSAEANDEVIRKATSLYVERGGSRPEAANLALAHINGLSTRFGGRPELYDVFDTIDPVTKMSLAQHNPALADNIAKARKGAEDQLKHTLFKEGLLTRSIATADLEQGLVEGRFDGMTTEQIREVLRPNIGEQGIFNNDKELAAFEHRVYERQANLAVRGEHRRAVMNGTAGALDVKDQKSLLAEAAQPYLATIMQSFNDPQQSQNVQAAMRAIVDQTARGGFDVGLPALKGLIGSLEKDIVSEKSTRPAKFDSAVAFYQSLKGSNNSRLTAEYFSENLQHVMESYLRNTGENQIASDTAYISAYESLSPESRKRAEEMRKEMGPKLREKAHNTINGWWRRHLPFTDVANTTHLQQSVLDEGTRYLGSRPWAGPDEVEAHIARWTQNNTYRDSATNAVIEVPQALNSPNTQAALTEWLGMVGKAWTKGDTVIVPRLKHKGAGVYGLWLESPGGGLQYQQDVDLDSITSVHRAKTNILGDEFVKLGAIRRKIMDGTLTPAEAADNAQLIQKAADLNVFDSDTRNKAWNLRRQGLEQSASAVFADAVDKAETKYAVSPSAILRDPDAHSNAIASQFFAKGDYAGALTAQRERVRLVAYKDPARGMNIGIGYNMTVNAATLQEDFRKAGIPADHIPAIQASQRAITPDQAVRLYQAVKPRYEAMAKSGMESKFPGEWQKLPANAKAVLTDLAYQTGNIAKFEMGLAALKRGDFSGSHLQASFVDRGTKQRRVDERGHALRVAMLKNAPTFKTLLSHASKQPASQIDARLALSGGSAE